VLTATPHSYGKGQISTPYIIKTSERIGIKLGTVDYIPEICPPQTEFGDSRMSGSVWGICKIYDLSYFTFSPNRPGGHIAQPIFTHSQGRRHGFEGGDKKFFDPPPFAYLGGHETEHCSFRCYNYDF